MLTLADLDRDELIALAEAHCPLGGADLARARFEAARKREERLHRAWREASMIATTDARAAKDYAERSGYDDRFRALFEKSKRSTREAAELWKSLERLARRREQLGRELKRIAA